MRILLGEFCPEQIIFSFICYNSALLKIESKESFDRLLFKVLFKVWHWSLEFDMLVGSAIVEEFIDHIERDDLVRLRWLKRIRETGFDQALSEYRESLNRLRQS